MIYKITVGFVTQTFETHKNKFVSQDFTAGDTVDYEDSQGNPLDNKSIDFELLSKSYLPFDMVQPGKKYIQLLDTDSKQIGILKTDADESTLDELFNNYTAIESRDKSIDEFVGFCVEKHLDYFFERFFLDEERILEI